MQIKYAAIVFNFDPVTETDLVYTRQELVSGSLQEALADQESLIKQTEGSYKSYIQVRQYSGKHYKTDHLESIVEVSL